MIPPTSNQSPSRILVIEPNPDLRELEETILSDDGYRVETPPDESDPVETAARSAPDVIVLGISGTNAPRDWQILDQLQANPRTRTIPVVIISTSEHTAAAAQATPVVGSVGRTIVAPYNINALEDAVAHALKNPPPAAVLPPPSRQPSPAVVFAADELNAHARQLALDTVQKLRGTEPYKSRFTELTIGLVDDFGTMLGAIIDGLRRGLAPRVVFQVPVIRQAIERHVRLREKQGLGKGATIREDLILRGEIDRFIRGLAGKQGFTANDASEVNDAINRFVGELMRVIDEEFTENP
ncbi:MAG TPA: hypothetical protein VFZ25_16420 [Chloroflexota bacterium]|nr:hypothetical protein [Chloroflexota bacterium]